MGYPREQLSKLPNPYDDPTLSATGARNPSINLSY